MATLKDLFTYPVNSDTNFSNETYFAALFDAGYFVTGNKYQIKFVGTTDFTLIGASANTVGTIFTASGPGTGTGTAWDIASGLLGRFNKLKDEDYKAIPGSLSISGTDDLMKSTSRFVNYIEDLKDTRNKLNFYDFYNWPILRGTLRTINAQDISSATSTAGETTLTFSSAHGFLDNDQVLCTGFDGAMAQLNGQVMFVVLVDSTNLKLSFTTGGGDIYNPDDLSAEIQLNMQYVNQYHLSGNSGAQTTLIDKTVTLDLDDWAGTEDVTDLTDGTGVLINDVDNNGTDLETNTYYAKGIGGTVYELYEDSNLTNPLKSSEVSTFNSDDIVGYSTVNTPFYTSGYVLNEPVPSYTRFTPGRYFNKGEPYKITEVGTTDWTSVGASSNTVGETFVSTATSYNGNGKVQSLRAGFTGYRHKPYSDPSTGTEPAGEDQFYWQLRTTTALTEKQRFIRADIADQDVNLNNTQRNYTTGSDETIYGIGIATLQSMIDESAETTYMQVKKISDGYYNIAYESNFLVGTHYFNKYTHLEKDVDGNITMHLLSEVYNYNQAFVNGTAPYPYEGLEDCKFRIPKRLIHNVKMFNGFGFTGTASNTLGPTAGTISNQPGKPVIDPVPVYCKIDNNRVWISGNNAFDTTVNDYTKIWGLPLNDYHGQVVLWDPSATIENYRTPVDEFENLNIMSKTTTTYDVDEFTVQATTSTVGDNTKPALVTHIEGDYSDHPVTRPDGTEYYCSIALGALNDWLGTSYTNGDTFSLELSPCPYTDITHSASGYYNPGVGHFFTDVEPNSGVDGNVTNIMTQDTSPGALYQYEVNEFLDPSPFHVEHTEHSGLSYQTSYYSPFSHQLRFAPTLFVLANPLEIQSQDFGSVNVTFLFNGMTVATQGNLAPNGDKIYELDTVTVVNPGAQVYSYLNSSGATAYGAEIKNDYWTSGGTSARNYTTTGETKPTVTITVDGSGYWSGATLDTSARGRYSVSATSGNDVLLPLKALDDAYTARTTTLVEQEDTFETQDFWVDPGFNLDKEWPYHVLPRSASITYNNPSTVNLSQNGKKFVRASGISKWQLELEYPPMPKSDFDYFHKVVQAVQGQNIPFYFVLDPSVKALFWNMDLNPSTTEPVIIEEDSNKSIYTIGGFDAHEPTVFKNGEIVIMPAESNGALRTILNQVDSNVYGEAKVRLSHPNNITFNPFGQKTYKNPYHVIVTLGQDNFDYTIGTNGFYYMSVKLDLDYWK